MESGDAPDPNNRMSQLLNINSALLNRMKKLQIKKPETEKIHNDQIASLTTEILRLKEENQRLSEHLKTTETLLQEKDAHIVELTDSFAKQSEERKQHMLDRLKIYYKSCTRLTKENKQLAAQVRMCNQVMVDKDNELAQTAARLQEEYSQRFGLMREHGQFMETRLNGLLKEKGALHSEVNILQREMLSQMMSNTESQDNLEDIEKLVKELELGSVKPDPSSQISLLDSSICIGKWRRYGCLNGGKNPAWYASIVENFLDVVQSPQSSMLALCWSYHPELLHVVHPKQDSRTKTFHVAPNVIEHQTSYNRIVHLHFYPNMMIMLRIQKLGNGKIMEGFELFIPSP